MVTIFIDTFPQRELLLLDCPDDSVMVTALYSGINILSTNHKSVFRSRDLSGPIRGQYYLVVLRSVEHVDEEERVEEDEGKEYPRLDDVILLYFLPFERDQRSHYRVLHQF